MNRRLKAQRERDKQAKRKDKSSKVDKPSPNSAEAPQQPE